MLIFCPIQALPIVKTDKSFIYNFTSYNEAYTRLHIFPPQPLVMIEDEYTFDMEYAKYLLFNDQPFFDLMMIIYNLYLGNDVILLIDMGEEFENINESLMKFIQQRYGYNGCIVTSYDDYFNADSGQFNELGVYNLDQDLERLSEDAEEKRLKAGGIPYFKQTEYL